MAALAPSVFIAYNNGSAEQKELVLRFAARLRKNSIDARIDK
ncbi:MAG: hypothetical protein WB586_15820 [Chthoniobacterales bacterium]